MNFARYNKAIVAVAAAVLGLAVEVLTDSGQGTVAQLLVAIAGVFGVYRVSNAPA